MITCGCRSASSVLSFLTCFLFSLSRSSSSAIQRRSSSASQRASFGPVGEIEKRDDAEEQRRQSFEDEQPSPAVPPKPVDAHQRGGDRGADHVRCRDRHHEHGDGLRAILVPEPVRQVDDDAGEEAGLRDAKEKAHPVELARPCR